MKTRIRREEHHAKPVHIAKRNSNLSPRGSKIRRGLGIVGAVSLVVLVTRGPRPASGATNDTYRTAPVTVIESLRGNSAPQSTPGAIGTTIHEKLLFESPFKTMNTNSINVSNAWMLWAPGQQAGLTNSVRSAERTATGPLDAATVTRLSQCRQLFSNDDKYGGILYKAYRAEDPLQLVNPFAPRDYGQSEVVELSRDGITGVSSGLSVFSLRFK